MAESREKGIERNAKGPIQTRPANCVNFGLRGVWQRFMAVVAEVARLQVGIAEFWRIQLRQN